MNKIITFVIALGVLSACAPELGAGRGERCDEVQACRASLQCYRGFCIPDDVPSDASVQGDEEPVVREEPGASSILDAGARPQTSSADGVAADARSPSASLGALDAGTRSGASTSDAAAALDAEAEAKAPKAPKPSEPAVTTPPATPADAGSAAPPASSPLVDSASPASAPVDSGPPASSPPVTPAQPATPANPAVPAQPIDAGTSTGSDAAPAAPVPNPSANCTINECCEEAARRAREQAGGSASGGGKKCGCEDPALVRAVACLVITPLGGLL